MSSSAFIGLSLGILIGVVSAMVVLLMIRFAVSAPRPLSYLLSVVAQLLALAAFWAGGTWASGNMLKGTDQLTVETWYWVGLLVSFLIPTVVMLFWLSFAVGQLTRVALEAEIRNR